MRLRIREEHRAMPAYEKPPAWRVDVYSFNALFLMQKDFLFCREVISADYNRYQLHLSI